MIYFESRPISIWHRLFSWQYEADRYYYFDLGIGFGYNKLMRLAYYRRPHRTFDMPSHVKVWEVEFFQYYLDTKYVSEVIGDRCEVKVKQTWSKRR